MADLSTYRRCNSDPGRRLKSKSIFLLSKYPLKTSASSSLLNWTCMMTLSCARWYSNLEGAHLCLSSHSRIPAISDEKSASGGSLTIMVRILFYSRPRWRYTPAELGRSGARLGGHPRRRSHLGLARARPARCDAMHTVRQKNVSRTAGRAQSRLVPAGRPLSRVSRVSEPFR